MAAAIGLRIDCTTDDLRRLDQGEPDAKQMQRLLALAAVYEGGSRTDLGEDDITRYEDVYARG